jgi:two-component system, OmpR family, sensor kinase
MTTERVLRRVHVRVRVPRPRAFRRFISPFKRLLRAQLRLRVLAGVVAIALTALVAFDIAAVTVLRGYLLTQTDETLQAVLTVTQPRLPVLLPPSQAPAGAAQWTTSISPVTQVQDHSIVGDYDVAYVPAHGTGVILEVRPGPQAKRLSPPVYQSLATHPTPENTTLYDGTVKLRVSTAKVFGGTLVVSTDLSQVDQTIGRIQLIVTLGSIAAVLLIALGVFLLLRRGLRPVESMAAQADRITAGDLTERVDPEDQRSEVGRLGSALNGMLGRIETFVHERDAGQEAMRRFFADASHELRTPLASLRANAELYQQGALPERTQVDEVMRRITLETQRMSTLVDDMLHLARLDQHPTRRHDPVDLSELITECVERGRSADPTRIWHTEIDPGLALTADEELLRRAVDNLLANVRAHTTRDTAATITATRSEHSLRIEVSDNGPGVPPEQLPHIFDRFYRARSAAPRPGSGLGLAIVTEVANAHGGTACATLNDPHGLRITLTLPDRQDSEPAFELNLAADSGEMVRHR